MSRKKHGQRRVRILVDENVPKLTVEELAALGHNVMDVRGTSIQGASDAALWRIAQAERRLMISTDRYFERHRVESHAGVLIVSLHRPNETKIHKRVMYAIARFSPKRWTNLTVVVKDEVMNVWQSGRWIQFKLPKL